MVAPLVPPTNLSAYWCTWRLDAPNDTATELNKTLQVKVVSLVLTGTRYRTPCSKYWPRIQLMRPGQCSRAMCSGERSGSGSGSDEQTLTEPPHCHR